MKRTLSAILFCSIALAACGDDDDDPEAADEPASTNSATTEAATTTASPTTTSTSTTTTSTLPPDPLDEALAPYGVTPVPDDLRDAFETLCQGFRENDPEAINGSDEGETAEPLAAAFGVLCPQQVAKIGTLVMPSGDPVFDGYPLLVQRASVDRRVANWTKTEELVALAPGVYAEYNPVVPELWRYLGGPGDGDCAVREAYFPNSGGACWNGVLPGPEEPELQP